MSRLIRRLHADECGAILSAELILILTLLVMGLVVGLSSLQGAIVSELTDVARAFGSLNQSYYVHGKSSYRYGNRGGCHGCGLKAYTAGSSFTDHVDDCDVDRPEICGSVEVAPTHSKPAVVAPRKTHVAPAPCENCPPATEPEAVAPGQTLQPVPEKLPPKSDAAPLPMESAPAPK